MYAERCGEAALGMLAMRGLPIDKDHVIYRERVASLPTALFSGSDMPVCAAVVACDVERLIRFLESLCDAELAVLCPPTTELALLGVSVPCAVIDALDALASRVAGLCARLVRRGVKRARA